MEKTTRIKITVELIWWIVTAILTLIVIFPMLNTFQQYDFIISNSIFVIVTITFSRYIFLLKHTFLAYFRVGKVLLLFGCIPLIFYLIGEMNHFSYFLDNKGLQSFNEYFVSGIDIDTRQTILNYLEREMIFTGTASVIVSALLPFRMLISVWRVYNKTGKV
ncbi:MAG: hypothetical protein MK212_00975 [Saprospiraceae bacterium]|nr:hypothetical protein [Saprospiraceae bacterium]